MARRACGGRVSRRAAIVVRRYLAYTVAAFLLMGMINLLVGEGDYSTLVENRLIEWMQFGMVAGTGAFLMLACFRSGESGRVLAVVLGSIACFAALRELDELLDALIPVVGWKIAFALPVFAIVYALRHRSAFVQGLDRLVSMPAFALFWSGFLIAVPLAQLLGHGELLQALMGDDYIRAYKHVIEESAELIGYWVIVAAALEFRLTYRPPR